jgi:hypothetical protein
MMGCVGIGNLRVVHKIDGKNKTIGNILSSLEGRKQ